VNNHRSGCADFIGRKKLYLNLLNTLPMKKRKMENCNQINGKYGIRGHDIRDLMLDEALVYRDDKGVVTLTPEIDS